MAWREAVDVAPPLLVPTHQAVGRHGARRSLPVVGRARSEVLVGEQELLGWIALVCGAACAVPTIRGLWSERTVCSDHVCFHDAQKLTKDASNLLVR